MKELGFQSHLINVSSAIEDWGGKERVSQLINVSSVIEGQREKERVRESAFLEGERVGSIISPARICDSWLAES